MIYFYAPLCEAINWVRLSSPDTKTNSETTNLEFSQNILTNQTSIHKKVNFQNMLYVFRKKIVIIWIRSFGIGCWIQ